jgi:hypothetical protein
MSSYEHYCHFVHDPVSVINCSCCKQVLSIYHVTKDTTYSFPSLDRVSVTSRVLTGNWNNGQYPTEHPCQHEQTSNPVCSHVNVINKPTQYNLHLLSRSISSSLSRLLSCKRVSTPCPLTVPQSTNSHRRDNITTTTLEDSPEVRHPVQCHISWGLIHTPCLIALTGAVFNST